MNDTLITPPLTTEAEQRTLIERHRVLDASVTKFKPGDAFESIAQALRSFEDLSRNDRNHVINTNTLKTKTDLVASEWICQSYQHLLAMAQAAVVRSFGGMHEGKGTPAQGCALVMLIAGHLYKWRKYSGGRADPNAREWLHQVYILAESKRIETSALSVRIEDRMCEATTEALYLRALLIDRFSGGNLSPKRFEILDTWFVVWIGTLWLTREEGDAEAALGINFRFPQRGLTPHVPGDGAQVFLSVRQVKRQLDRVIHGFHQGEIFPGITSTPNLKIDDQVAVIEFLERELQLIELGRERVKPTSQSRGKRVSLGANSIVAVYFGFKEICDLAFSPERANTLIGGGGELGIRNAIRLLDISEGGLGLEMVDEDARRINVNDLVAVRLQKGKPCVLGMIARKSTLQRPTGTLVGVKVLTKTPLKLTMDRVNASNQWENCVGMLIAGALPDGYGDSVILSQADYIANTLVAATLDGRVHEFYARRVREQGGDWRMAAIDAIDRSTAVS